MGITLHFSLFFIFAVCRPYTKKTSQGVFAQEWNVFCASDWLLFLFLNYTNQTKNRLIYTKTNISLERSAH